ncbi:MAG: DUF177 domain-containing protein [Acidobacteria bacterium]|nr:DUF177 domain-containing protein [Acidobacteriota bacterium]MBI3426185.1 DUF177 domain-containing protein [Acidobacteriota bacterium]
MKISLAHLPVEGTRFEQQYQTGELDVSAHEFALTESPWIAGRLKRSGMDVKLEGALKAALSVPCDRCLTDVAVTIDQAVNLVFIPLEAERVAKGETELHERDLEFSFYENDELDVDQVIREQLELALPVRVLCQADCRGICAQCGADLNTDACNCQPLVDPRWQELAELKAQLEPPE